MNRQYVTALEESLEKKVHVLDEIYRICQLQEEFLGKEPVDLEAFDQYVNDKDICIEKINKLDEGFEILYERVAQELKDNKAAYTKEIARMQQLISSITDKSVAIQALEERNKKAVGAVLAAERKELRQGKRSLNVAMNYYRSMSGAGIATSKYMDKKK
jgi:regulator of sigma D